MPEIKIMNSTLHRISLNNENQVEHEKNGNASLPKGFEIATYQLHSTHCTKLGRISHNTNALALFQYKQGLAATQKSNALIVRILTAFLTIDRISTCSFFYYLAHFSLKLMYLDLVKLSFKDLSFPNSVIIKRYKLWLSICQ